MSVFCEVYDFYSSFNGEKGVIGNSFFGLPIFYMAVKKTEYPKIIVQYAIHAREYITTYLALKQIEDFNKNGSFGSAYFIPLMNPDGVNICEGDRPLYKANGRGVDLNVNFDALWGRGESNVYYKCDQNYVGKFAFSETETQALRDFTIRVKPQATVSYHAKGEVIFWEFFQDKEKKKLHKKLAKNVSKVTGYKIRSSKNSTGGYKDWCVEKLGIPALTIEVGDDKLNHPLKLDALDDIYKKNKRVIEEVIETVKEITWN